MALTPWESDFLSKYAAGIAVDLTKRILDAAGNRIKRRFEGNPQAKALEAAITDALTSAIERLPLTEGEQEHYLGLFQEFCSRDRVAEELSQLLDPHPDAELNVPLLCGEFTAAGFDPDYIEFEEIVYCFVDRFSHVAATQPALQGLIQIGLLRKIASRAVKETELLSVVAEHTGEVAQLSEQVVRGQTETNELLRVIQENLASGAAGRSFDLYQQVAAGLERTGNYLSIDKAGQVEIQIENEGGLPAAELLREQLSRLRQLILGPSAALSSDELTAREIRYRNLLKETYSYLRLEGLSTGVKPIRLPLEKVYVDLRAVAEVPEAADAFTPEERRLLRLLEDGGQQSYVREAHLRLDAIRRQRWSADKLTRSPIAEHLRNPSQRGLVILGDPGSGKSTLLYFLAVVFARGSEAVAQYLKIEGPDGQRLPILASLAAYDDMLDKEPELTIREFLARFYDRRRAAPGLGPVFDHALNSGKALVLLDGLDEVVLESRRKYVAEQVSAFFLESTQMGNRVLLTSRIYGYRSAPLSVDVPHVTVLDFRREDMEIFARQWSRAMASWEADGEITPQAELAASQAEQSLLDEIRSNPGIESLATNPLLLTMLALLRRQVGKLPQRRIELYDLYLRTLIQNWEENRSRGARLSSPRRADALEAERALIPLSLWLQQERPSGTATWEELRDQLARIYLAEVGEDPDSRQIQDSVRSAALHRSEQFLRDTRQFSGLLVERGHNAFGFRHLTFQEYFAARALARMDGVTRWELLDPHLHENRWREPILLATARLGVTENRGDQATDLVQKIMNAASEHEELLHRDLFLAATCVCDDIGVDLPTLRRIVAGLGNLVIQPIPALQREAVNLLVGVTLLRAGEDLRVPEAAVALIPVFTSLLEQTRDRVLERIKEVWHASPHLEEAVEDFILRDISYGRSGKDLLYLGPFLLGSERVRSEILNRVRNSQDYTKAGAIEALSGLVGQDAEVREAVRSTLNDQEWSVRSAAIRGLSGLVGQDAEVREALLSKLNDQKEYVRRAAIGGLSGLVAQDAAVLKAVLNKLNDQEWPVRSAAIEGLSGLVGQDAAVREAVLSKLNDQEEYVRVAAISGLRGLVGQDAAVREAVLSKLNDQERSVRSAAIQGLSGLVGQDAAVREAVLSKLNDQEGSVRSAAIEGLSGDALRDRRVATAVGSLLSGQNCGCRFSVLESLSETREGLEVDTVVAEFSRLRCSESSAAMGKAVAALACLFEQDAAVREAVLSKLDDQEGSVRRAAIEGLSGLVGQDAAVREAMLSKLNDQDWSVRTAAIEGLSGLVGQDAAVREAVLSKFNDQIEDVRSAAIEGLSGLAGQDAAVREALLDKLNDQEEDVRKAAIKGLSRLVAQDAAVREAVLSKLNDQDGYVRGAAIKGLSGLVGQDAAVSEAVLNKLNDQDDYVRGAAIEGLSGLVGQDAAVREAVLNKLNDRTGFVRRAAIKGLSRLVGQDAAVREAVLSKFNDQEEYVCSAAVEELSGLVGQDAAVREALLSKLNDQEWSARPAAVAVLSGLVGQDAAVREAVLSKLNDQDEYVRGAAIKGLSGLVRQDAAVREAVLSKLNDQDEYVRRTAIESLAEAAVWDEATQDAVVTRLGDSEWTVQLSAARALATCVESSLAIRETLWSALGSDDAIERRFGLRQTRAAIVRAYGSVARSDLGVRRKLKRLLRSEDWRLRQSAAEAIREAGVEVIQETRDPLLKALEDDRGFDSWPARIKAAEILINDLHHSDAAIETILPALDYGTVPLAPIANSDSVRRSAVFALGKLKADYRKDNVIERLKRLLQEEQMPNVLEAAYQAMLSLVAAPELN